jgi:AcrR family transcriptional regulator
VLTAALEVYRDGIGPMLLKPAWAGIADPIERVFALLAAYRGMLERTDCLYGCPIGSIALELHEPDPPVRALLSANFEGWVKQVRGCFEAARDHLPAGLDTRRLALFVLTTMEGGVMQSRTHRSLEAFDACVAALRDYVERLQAERRASDGAS